MLLTCERASSLVARIQTLPSGADLHQGILGIARELGVRTGRVEAIGGVRKLKLGYYSAPKRSYDEREYEEFMEVTGILGNVTQKDGSSFLHVHGTFGRSDNSVIGGHVIAAEVFPLLEVVITPTENVATRKLDPALGLSIIDRLDG
jgi:uncharacterized protein